jgi:hypothetical protein
MKALVLLICILPLTGFGQTSPSNWTGKYAPCNRHTDLLSPERMNLAVRISTSDTILAEQFERALDFWTGVLDLEWHEVDSEECSIQLLDGTPSLFDWCTCLSARSQFPDRAKFQGWIAFNPRVKLTKQEMFLDSVHEIGHLLGLAHNANESSVMYSSELAKSTTLDAIDLDALAARHKLRPEFLHKGGMARVRVVEPRESVARQ